MPDGANNLALRSGKTPLKLLVLDGVGYVLFAAGAFYALASDSLHERLPFLTGMTYTAQILIGASTALVGIALLVVSDKLKRRATEVVNQRTDGVSL
jgi:hypothetical protein